MPSFNNFFNTAEGGGGGGLTWSRITSDSNAADGNGYLIDASSGAVTLTLPASPTDGDLVGFSVTDATNDVTIARNGNEINGAATDFLLTAAGQAGVLAYDSTAGWWLTTDRQEFSPAITDEQDGGSITIGATTTDPTLGTTARNEIRYWRTGEVNRYVYRLRTTGTGSAGSGEYLYRLPAGHSFATSVPKYTGSGDEEAIEYGIGWGSISRDGGSQCGRGVIVPYDDTRFRFFYSENGSTSEQYQNATNLSWWSGDQSISFEFAAAIAGQSGSQAVQPGSLFSVTERVTSWTAITGRDPEVLGEIRYRSAGADITTPAELPSAANGIPLYSGSRASDEGNEARIFIGKGRFFSLEGWASAGQTTPVEITPRIFATIDRIGVNAYYDRTTGVLTLQTGTDTTDEFGLILNASGEGTRQQDGYVVAWVSDSVIPVALAPAVHVEATSDAGQVVTANVTNLQYEDVAIDTHGAWDEDTFTAPVDGVYAFSACATSTSAPFFVLSLYLDGSLQADGHYQSIGGQRTTIAIEQRMAAGTTATIRATGSGTRDATTRYNWLRITRVGD